VILSLLIFLPLAGALLVGLAPRDKGAKAFAFGLALCVFFLSLSLLKGFDPADGGFQFKELRDLVPSVGIHYSLGLDGLSLWLVILTAFLTPLVVLSSWNQGSERPRGFLACLLLLESSVMGTLLSTDLFLFYVFWELMLIPAFFLVGLWGSAGRTRATLKFVLYTMAGSLLMLVALLYVVRETGSFDYTLAREHLYPEDAQVWCFLAFAAAFLIKVPLFPLHGWLPDAYAEAPTGGTVFFSALLVKLGAYGLLRFCVPLFPYAAQETAPLLLGLAVAGILHGALMASIATDVKRLLAYSSLSHMGLVVLGIFTFTLTGLQGSLFQMLSHGVAMAGLFFLAGYLEERSGKRGLSDLGGAAKSAPLLAVCFLWMMLSVVGLPGFSGFIGELLVLSAVWKASPALAGAALLGFVLSAWYLFNLFGRLFLGPAKGGAWKDLTWREGLAVLPLMVLVLWMGLKPNPILRPMEKTLTLKVLEELKPPPVMTDFAATHRRLTEEIEKDKRNRGKK